MTTGVHIRPERDALLTEFGKRTLENQYLCQGETYQERFATVAAAYSDNAAHAQRLYDYMSTLWFMPATPILSNGGTSRGLPISCFLNESEDSLESLTSLWVENISLASNGGGIGSYIGHVRAINEPVGNRGHSCGIIPFIKVQEALTLAVSQGSLRRGSAAVYLPIWHPEIEEFIEMRRPTGGDYNRRALNLHHGVVISHAFMEAVEKDALWALKSPKTGDIISEISARALWIRILTARLETGEPYILFIDHVNEARPEHYRKLGLEVTTSNLCSEITLITGKDHHHRDRTAVCCLSSFNLLKFQEWHHHPTFVEDVFRFLDNVLTDFITKAPPAMARAVYSATQARDVGVGVMGFHSLLQSLGVPMESAMALSWNRKIFTHLHAEAQRASRLLAEERGPCPDAADAGAMERFSHKIAIAPTASISIICGGTSPGIEPFVANAYTHKTLSGSFAIYNSHLRACLEAKGLDTPEVWSAIIQHNGSVQHLSPLSAHEKAVFKTAFEMDQRWLVTLASERQPYICQSQSLNLFCPSTMHKRDLHGIHYLAWKKGLKSLYYMRSQSVQRAESQLSAQEVFNTPPPASQELPLNYEECLACQ